MVGRPTQKRPGGKQSVWITSELFTFQINAETKDRELVLGTKKCPIGVLSFKAHNAYDKPASIHLSIVAGQWFVSFSSDDGLSAPDEKDTIAWLRMFTEKELLERTVGFDRGVSIPVMSSSGRPIDFSPQQKLRMQKKEEARKRWQRKLARQQKGSNNRAKTKALIARTFVYAKEVQKDLFHQETHLLISDPDKSLFVVEDLKVKNMTKKPKPKQDNTGQYVKNGARAKAGLNKAILSSGWGLFVVLLSYKARNAGKLLVKVAPHHSSQECAECSHIHPDNRLSQAEFVCQRCGHKDNADHNASRVLAKR